MKNSGSKQVLSIILAIILLNTSLSGCEKQKDVSESVSTDSHQDVEQEDMATRLALLPIESLSNEERNGLIFLREEEKLARDVYNYLRKYYNLNVFINIPKSEQQHMNAVKFLLDRYDISDPTEGKLEGEFKNKELQDLYNTLISKGKENVTEALKVGALIEEVDIRDLQKELINHVNNQDIKFVYNNLIRGSKNHIKAFTGVLKTYGIEYSPVILEQDFYNGIINK